MLNTLGCRGGMATAPHYLASQTGLDVLREGGSNGHFYDVVHGISLWDRVCVQDVYFDVTTQVNARSSRMAATDSMTATLP
jgi:hypothetical protein